MSSQRREAVLLIGDRDRQTLALVKRLSKELSGTCDILWAYDTTKAMDGIKRREMSCLARLIPYELKDLRLKSNTSFHDYVRLMVKQFQILDAYDYTWLMHSDTWWEASYMDLHDKVSAIDADYVGMKIRKWPLGRCDSWMWINDYIDSRQRPRDPALQCYMSSFTWFFRMSRNALRCLHDYTASDINEAMCELYVPTILYSRGMTLRAIDDESDEEFLTDVRIANEHTFRHGSSCTKSSLAKDPMKHTHLFNGYTSDVASNRILIDMQTTRDYTMDHVPCSVVIPLLKWTDMLEESIDSCFASSTNIELVIVDETDGDKCSELISRKYASYRVKHIVKKPSGLAESLNMAVKSCIGKWVLIHYPESIMSTMRIQVQTTMMSTMHAQVMAFSSNIVKHHDDNLGDTVHSCRQVDGGCLGMLRDAIVKQDFMFEQCYHDVFRMFVMHMDECGLNVMCSSCVVEQITSIPYEYTLEDTDKVHRCYRRDRAGDAQLTCILGFRNEGHEVEKTVRSIMATAHAVKVTLVNDASTDGVDYRAVAERYGCMYIEHTEAIGCAGSRDDGVKHCTTPYFILMDAHMRLYEMDWDIRLVEAIREHPSCIIGSNTIIIGCDDDGMYTNEDGTAESRPNTLSAFMNSDESKWFDVTWTSKQYDLTEHGNLITVLCPLGAGYCSSVEHWRAIDGLKGLHIYGLDEGLMAYKTWATGGHVYMLRDLWIGHLYRAKSPFPNSMATLESNRIMCYEAFDDPVDLSKHLTMIKKRIGSATYDKAMEEYHEREWVARDMRRAMSGKMKMTLRQFIEMNKKFEDRK